ncbi:MAG TPA: hypothetical protein VJ757_01425, partial [Pseudonocardiaceae bacterium]|nr:hypothetical protein [Pseudonocardiaceae bacterium]
QYLIKAQDDAVAPILAPALRVARNVTATWTPRAELIETMERAGVAHGTAKNLVSLLARHGFLEVRGDYSRRRKAVSRERREYRIADWVTPEVSA